MNAHYKELPYFSTIEWDQDESQDLVRPLLGREGRREGVREKIAVLASSAVLINGDIVSNTILRLLLCLNEGGGFKLTDTVLITKGYLIIEIRLI